MVGRILPILAWIVSCPVQAQGDALDEERGYCAQDNRSCAFSDTAQIRYGKADLSADAAAYGTHSGGVHCGNADFGNPLGGAGKECYYSAATDPLTPPPVPEPAPEPNRGVHRTRFTVGIGTWSNDGGLIAADVNDDGRMDLVLSQASVVVAYSVNGKRLWKISNPNLRLGGSSAETRGLPGHHGPGLQAGDVDDDGTTEVLFVTNSNELKVINGRTGDTEKVIKLPPVKSKWDKWDHAIIADFRNKGDRDILLASSVAVDHQLRDDKVRDNKIAAYTYAELATNASKASRLWIQEGFLSPSHSPARVVDLNGDGRDEVVGGKVVSHDGKIVLDTDVSESYSPHVDSIAIGDIDPDISGIEAVLVEEGGERRIIMYNRSNVIWEKSRNPATDGDKVQVGNYDTTVRGLEIWMRGSESDDMWVLDRRGRKLADYDFDSTRTGADWTKSGVEVIFAIDWTGGAKQYNVAKERHASDDVGIFDPMNAKFIRVFDESADRVYVADVEGDWREEVVVVSGRTLSIYRNDDPNLVPGRASLWESRLYRRKKMTWNYYQP